MNGSRPSFDPLEVGFAIELDTGAVEQRLVRTRTERITNGDQEAREDETRNAVGKPTADHSRDLNEGAEDQAATISELVSEPASRDLESHEK